MVLDRVVDNFFAETEQVAFCTQNIVPGVDFTNDPLLQGRNFSYLDTQIKRLGSPNFSHLPINAPKCPFANFQQDGHMAFHSLKGRANYNPNSWDSGPREQPSIGFNSFAEPSEGHKLRARPEKFADHYSQARQFYLSLNPIEKNHLSNALIFELSKVEKEVIRIRMVSHLLNIENKLANTVAKGLGIQSLPLPCDALKPTLNLSPSFKLSILDNNKKTFAGRSVGIMVGEGADASLFNLMIKAIKKEKASYVVIGPTVGGVKLSDGQKIIVNEKIDNMSYLYDSVALLIDIKDPVFANNPKVTEFVINAYQHFKFKFKVKAYHDPRLFLADMSPHWKGCILIDLLMPSMNGIELTKIIKKNNNHLNIIIMSGYETEDIVADSIAAGACMFITKPFKSEYLLEHLGCFLEFTTL